MSPKQIIAWRLRFGMTQAAAAALVGVDRRTWARWEGAERAVPSPVERLLRLCETLPDAVAVLEGMVGLSGVSSELPLHLPS